MGEDTKDWFARCPKCGRVWFDQAAFERDSDWILNGYQEGFLGRGRFLVTHTTTDCGSTFAIAEEHFAALCGIPYPGGDAASLAKLNGFVQQVLTQLQARMVRSA